MRVLHINLSPSGLGLYGAAFHRALREAGVDVISIFEQSLAASPIVSEAIPGARYIALPAIGGRQRWRAAQFIRRYVEHNAPDVIHDTAGPSTIGPVLHPALARRAPLILTDHELRRRKKEDGGPGRQLARRVSRRAASRLFVHGKAGADDLSRAVKAKFTVLPHPALSAFNRKVWPDVETDGRTVLFFGTLRADKGADLLPAIAAAAPHTRFLIAGKAPASNHVRSTRPIMDAVHQMRADPRFELHLDFVDDGEVEYYFRRADVVVMPYRSGTQSGVLMTSMAFGKPVVTTAVGDIGPLVRQHAIGTVAEGDAVSIGACISQLLSDAELYRHYADKATQAAAGPFAPQTIGETAAAIYEAVIAANKGTATPLSLAW